MLCYAQQNSVEPFLEPVLLLAHAMMLYDTPAVASSSSGQLLEVYLTQLLTFADLCSHADSAVALAAAQCVAQLVSGGWWAVYRGLILVQSCSFGRARGDELQWQCANHVWHDRHQKQLVVH